jgi:RNA polymerase sigma-B factor
MKELAVEISTQLPLLEQRLGRAPSTAELSEFMGINEDELLQAMAARRTYRAMPLIDMVDEDDSAEVSAPDGDNHAMGVERVTLWAALCSLDDEDRAIVVLRYFGGLTQSEIADREGISQAKASRRLRDVLSRLRPLVAPG